MDIWSAVNGAVLPPVSIQGELVRVVESQEQVATNSLVDTLYEQDILERLLDDNKPPVPENTQHLDYLLFTPFRYPPLKHGSRFGSRFEPSLFYGSLSVETALAETGYYRLLFWQGMTIPPPSGKLTTQHTVFGADYATDMGIQLQSEPFSDFEDPLRCPDDYRDTQQLGTAMRDAGIEGFEYVSARDPDKGINVALYDPVALTSEKPKYQRLYLCQVDASAVSFFSKSFEHVINYPLDTFLVNGQLPSPAV